MTFDQTSNSSRPNAENADLEHRMRRTLGVHAPNQGQRRRFAQEGDVPVVINNRRDAERDAGEAAMQKEREARQQAERLLTAAQATIRDLQTKLAHAEMSLSETREAVHRSDQRVKALEATRPEQRPVDEVAEHQKAKEGVARTAAKTSLQDKRRKERSTPPAKVQPGPTVSRFAENQKPVDWWSKQEKRK
jgi:hypothetical protein